jgi:purine-binding chemotaxis protein CheW
VSSDQKPAPPAQAHPALLEMLESLLAEVPQEPVSPAPASEPEVRPTPAPVTTEVAEAAPTAAPPATASPAEPLNKVASAPIQSERECVVHGRDAQQLNTPESEFSAILFSSGRYRFAAALNSLDGITRVSERPTPIFGQPDWHRGVVLHRGQQLVLVDPGLLLDLRDVEPVTEPDHVLVLPGGRYGVLSSQAPEPVTLRGGGIRWSRPNGQRPWLAALLPEQMCVLADMEALLEMIQA